MKRRGHAHRPEALHVQQNLEYVVHDEAKKQLPQHFPAAQKGVEAGDHIPEQLVLLHKGGLVILQTQGQPQEHRHAQDARGQHRPQKKRPLPVQKARAQKRRQHLQQGEHHAEHHVARRHADAFDIRQPLGPLVIRGGKDQVGPHGQHIGDGVGHKHHAHPVHQIQRHIVYAQNNAVVDAVHHAAAQGEQDQQRHRAPIQREQLPHLVPVAVQVPAQQAHQHDKQRHGENLFPVLGQLHCFASFFQQALFCFSCSFSMARLATSLVSARLR